MFNIQAQDLNTALFEESIISLLKPLLKI